MFFDVLNIFIPKQPGQPAGDFFSASPRGPRVKKDNWAGIPTYPQVGPIHGGKTISREISLRTRQPGSPTPSTLSDPKLGLKGPRYPGQRAGVSTAFECRVRPQHLGRATVRGNFVCVRGHAGRSKNAFAPNPRLAPHTNTHSVCGCTRSGRVDAPWVRVRWVIFFGLYPDLSSPTLGMFILTLLQARVPPGD